MKTGFYCTNYTQKVLFDVYNRNGIVKTILNVLEEEYNGPNITAAVPKLFKSCAKSDKDVKFHQQVEKFIAEVGGCPLLSKTWSETDFDLERAIGILMAKHGIDSFFSVYFNFNEIHIAGRFEDLKNLQNKTMFDRLFQSFSAEVIPSDALDRSRSELLYLQQSINKAGEEESFDRLSVKVENLRLNKNISTFNWAKLLDTLSAYAGTQISNDTVLIGSNKYNKLTEFVKNTPKRILANLVVWILLNDLDEKLSDEPRLAFEDKKPLVMRCWQFVVQEFDYVVEKLVVNKTVTQTLRYDLNTITKIAKTAVNNHVDKLDWMDNETKLKAHEKVQRINFSFDLEKDPNAMRLAMEKKYPVLRKLTGDNFAKDLSLINLEKFRKSIQRLKHKYQVEYKKEDPKSNDIILSSGHIFYPRYLINGPFVSNVATFGTFMAMEVLDKIRSNAYEIFTSHTMEKYEAFSLSRGFYKMRETTGFQPEIKMGIFPELFKAFKAYVVQNNEPNPSVRLPGVFTNYSISTDFLLSYTNSECLENGSVRPDPVTNEIVKEYGNEMLKRC